MNREEKYKQCSTCKQYRQASEFKKDTRKKDNLSSNCVCCAKEASNRFRKSKHGLTTVMYHRQKIASKKRGYALPKYSMSELREWVYAQPNFDKLYTDWVASGYIKDLLPSCDRHNNGKDYDYLPYSLDLLRLVTYKENREKYYIDARNGVNTKACKAVSKYSLDGVFICTYYSIGSAGVATGANRGHISSVCAGHRKSAGGFIWRHCI